ncbi:MAG TPA: hypothetical protein VLM78_08955, partial [Anaerolineales bacterium]|nr:hypothetical protein [Anaerolineales bacterium]
EVLAMFEREAEKVRAGLAGYDGVPQQAAEYIEMMHAPRETFFWLLTLDAGIKSAQAHLAWLEDVIQRIKNHEIPPA